MWCKDLAFSYPRSVFYFLCHMFSSECGQQHGRIFSDKRSCLCEGLEQMTFRNHFLESCMLGGIGLEKVLILPKSTERLVQTKYESD